MFAYSRCIVYHVVEMKRVEEDIGELRKEIARLDRRITSLEYRMARLEGAYTELSKRIDGLDKKLDLTAKITLMLTTSVMATLITQITLTHIVESR